MTLLSRAVPNTIRASSTLIRSSAVKHSSSSISRRYASDIKSTLKSSKATPQAKTTPPLLSTKLFELPKPRPLAKQRYESTAGVVESSLLVLGFAVAGTLYGREHMVTVVEEENGLESEEDHNIHEWIKPFDCYVVEEEVPVDAAAVNVAEV